MMDHNDWVFNPRYSIDFGSPDFETPPMCPNGKDEEGRLSSYKWYAKDGVEKHTIDGKEWEWPVGEFKPGVDHNVLETTEEWDESNRIMWAAMEAETNKLKREGTKKFSTNKGTRQAEVCGEYAMTYWVNDEGKITVTQTSTWKGAPRPPVPKYEDPMGIPTWAFLGDDTEHECDLCKDDEVFKSAKRNCPAFIFGRPLRKMAPQLMFLDLATRTDPAVDDIKWHGGGK